MFCSKCGNQNSDSATFCGNCGTPLSRSGSATISAVPGTAPAPVAASMYVTMHTPAASGAPVVSAANKTGHIIGIVVVVLVAMLAIVAFATNGFGLIGSGESVDPNMPEDPNISAESQITVAPRGSVNDYSWSELSEISAGIAMASDENAAIEIAKKYNLATHDGKLDGTQTKTIELSNGNYIRVQIVDFNHDNKTDGGKAGITFIFKDAVAKHAMNSSVTNAGGWKDSEMRSWLALDGMNLLPDDLRSKIVAVDKMTNNAGETKSVSSVTKTSDKLWLFSQVELGGGMFKSDFTSKNEYAYDIYQAEGTEYKLFKDCSVASNSGNRILVKNDGGKPVVWWERSSTPSSSEVFSGVTSDGNPSNGGNYSSNPCSVVPGFCI